MKTPIYFDNHSSTKVHPEVVEAMLPYFSEHYGNPSANHILSWSSEKAIEKARQNVAQLIGAQAREIVFTSSATESINMLLKSCFEANVNTKNHIISTKVEHKAVLKSLEYLKSKGAEYTLLDVDAMACVSPEQLEQNIQSNSFLFSCIMGQNEIGSINPIQELSEICQKHNILFHIDATQVMGKFDFDIKKLGADFVSLSAHKFHGPKGIGALYIKNKSPRIKLNSFIHGGDHERGLRAGTLNTPYIIAFGKACEMALANQEQNILKLLDLRKKLKTEIEQQCQQHNIAYRFNADSEDKNKKLANNLHITFYNIDIGELKKKLSHIAFSTGSACSNASGEMSHVLKALNFSEQEAKNSIRLGLSIYNTETEITDFGQSLSEAFRQNI